MALARAAEQQVSAFNNEQELANTAWAFATVNRSDEKLLVAMVKAAEQRGSELNSQKLANVTWNGAWALAWLWRERLGTV